MPRTAGDSPQSPQAFVVLKHMSKRELRALVGAEDPASPAPEPEAEEEAEGSEEGLAEAARLARVGAEVEEELERARESARSLKECFGKRVPSAAEAASWRSSLCCLARPVTVARHVGTITKIFIV